VGKYSGMTTNERLFNAGLLDAFDNAAQSGDKAEMVRLFSQVEFDAEGATRIAEAVLADPTRYGRLKL
jgi:hypothetical protein